MNIPRNHSGGIAEPKDAHGFIAMNPSVCRVGLQWFTHHAWKHGEKAVPKEGWVSHGVTLAVQNNRTVM
ncbi:hypothetical protein HMPREF9374_3288 [Desmospora sp. 8437]|nr:hypothetical protein HMPREF9374_3288 [Desmospora sp. 8437]